MSKKGSLISSILGFIVVIISIALIWWNEDIAQKAKRQNRTINQMVYQVDSNTINADRDGKLIFLTGSITYDTGASDFMFDVNVDSPKLKRVVEKYQYEEIKNVDEEGNITYTYEGGWHSTYINSNTFHNKEYVNPTEMPYETTIFYPEKIYVGKHKLSTSLRDQLSTTVVYKELDPIIAEIYDLTINDIYYTNSIDPKDPQIGDIRISFLYSDVKEASVLAMQSFDSFITYTANTGITYNKLIDYKTTKEHMINTISSDNDLLRYELRFSLIVLLFVMLIIFIRPFTKFVEKFPFFGPINKDFLLLLVLLLTILIYSIEAALVWLIYELWIAAIFFVIIIADVFAIFLMGKRNRLINEEKEMILYKPQTLVESKEKVVGKTENNEGPRFILQEENIVKSEGIFLPVFSLPNNHGIGDFGKCAYDFVDLLSNYGIKYWQILPLNPINENNNPYSPVSSFAINPLYISIDLLNEWGLLNEEYTIENNNKINYSEVKKYKYAFFKRSYIKFVNSGILKAEYDNFVSTCIDEFPKYAHMKYNEDINYQFYLQFLAYKQWMKLKEYANSKGVMIIGDVPMYVDQASSDVFHHTNNFLMVNGKMSFVGGVKKGIYTDTEEVWTQPLYDFENMRKDGFKYLLDKYKYACSLYDVVRIDNFTAFESFYKIPYGMTVDKGTYEKGIGKEFLNILFNKYNPSKFIVDDLYNNTPESNKLRDFYGLSGTKIFKFAFSFEYAEDMMFESKKMSVYTSNYETNTLYGWYDTLTNENKIKLNEFLSKYNGSINTKVIKYLLESEYRYLILNAIDILELDDQARIKIPNSQDNWTYRISSLKALEQKMEYYFKKKEEQKEDK